MGDAWVVLQPGWRDLVTAGKAIAPFALIQPFEGSFDTLSLGLPSPFRRQGHGLDLHRIDTRKPTHAVLIERHGCAISCADPVFLIQLFAAAEKTLPCSRFVHRYCLSTEQQYRQGEATDHGGCRASDDHAAQRRMAIGSHYQHVGVALCRVRLQRTIHVTAHDLGPLAAVT